MNKKNVVWLAVIIIIFLAGLTVVIYMNTRPTSAPSHPSPQPGVSARGTRTPHDQQSQTRPNHQPNEPGKGTGGFAPTPVGMSQDEFVLHVREAATVAARYWLTKNSSAYTDPTGWLTVVKPLSTTAQQERDRQWGHDRQSDIDWLIQQKATCHGEAWTNQAWPDATVPATATRMLIAIPTRQWCTYKAQDPTQAQVEKKNRESSSGIGGYHVTITSFDMVKQGDRWLVDYHNRIRVSAAAP